MYHGDTCAGQVFTKMFTTVGTQNATFATDEQCTAFFLEIFKSLIEGIEKDEGYSHMKDCVNHGNFGECVAGLFDPSSQYHLYGVVDQSLKTV